MEDYVILSLCLRSHNLDKRDEILTIPAVNVSMGRKTILSRISGYCVHTNPRIPMIAPD